MLLAQNDYQKRRRVPTPPRRRSTPHPEVAAKLDAVRRPRGRSRGCLRSTTRSPGLPEVTRGDVAAVLGVRLAALLAPAGDRPGVLVTDVRTHWAATWILAVVRAGVMEPLPNHTFQPQQRVRRVDLAQIVGRVLALIAARRPAAGGRVAGRRA